MHRDRHTLFGRKNIKAVLLQRQARVRRAPGVRHDGTEELGGVVRADEREVDNLWCSGLTHTQRTCMGGMAGGMHVDDLPRYTVTSTFRTVDFEIQGESTTAPVATALIAGNIYIIRVRM